MEDDLFMVLLELRRIPHPTIHRTRLATLDIALNSEARKRGLGDWEDAYHHLLSADDLGIGLALSRPRQVAGSIC